VRHTTLVFALIPLLASAPVEAKKKSVRAPQPPAAPATPPAEPSIPASSWQSLKGSWVEASLRDGTVVRGRVAGADAKTATVVLASGDVKPVDLTNVVALRETSPPPTPPPLTLDNRDAERATSLEKLYGHNYKAPKGRGMHNAGAIVLSLGLTQLVLSLGLLIAAVSTEDEVFGRASGGLLVSGLVHVAVGAPLLVKGKRRRLTYYDWLHKQEMRDQARVVPGFVPLRGGGGMSLRLAF